MKSLVTMCNEAISEDSLKKINALTGIRPIAIEQFLSTNKISDAVILKALKSKKLSGMDLMTAIAGKPDNKITKKIVADYGSSDKTDDTKKDSKVEPTSKVLPEIKKLTSLGEFVLKNFFDKNKISDVAVLKALKSKKLLSADLMTAIAGNPNNHYQKELISKYGI